MGAARIVYTGGPGFDPAPVLAENMLRVFVLLSSNQCIAEHREWLARAPWEQGFKDVFAQTIRWKRDTLAKGAAHVYRLSHEYRKRPDARENIFDSLSYNLLQRAAKMGHAEAKAELPNRIHPFNEPASRTEFRGQMFNRARANQVWAQKYLASDYLYSGHFEKAPLKSYYWLLRAQANGVDVSDKSQTVLPMLSEKERLRVREWIDKGIVPGL